MVTSSRLASYNHRRIQSTLSGMDASPDRAKVDSSDDKEVRRESSDYDTRGYTHASTRESFHRCLYT